MRHVTYDPVKEDSIDFTWEREWRIKTENLKINEENSTIVVPTEEWADALVDNFNWDIYYFERQQYEIIYGDILMAELMASSNGYSFDWPILTLKEKNGI